MGFLARLRSGEAHGLVFISLIILSLLLRAMAFGRSVIDWDETTYILIGRDLLAGKLLYVDMWDTKPPGIFLIFAGIEWLFSDAILGARLVASLFVALTAWFIYRIGRIIKPSEPELALFAGLFFIIGISFYSFSFAIGRGLGLEANTEMFFIAFAVWGMYLYLCCPGSYMWNFIAGLVMGIGFIIKYLVLFDMLALMAAILVIEWGRGQAGLILRLLKHGLASGIGMLIPFGLLVAYYYFLGDWDAFYSVTFGVATDYAEPLRWSKLGGFLGDFFYLGGIISLCLAVVLVQGIRNKALNDKYIWILAIWFLAAIIGAIAPGKFFRHYLYQLLPAFVLLAAYFVCVGFYASNQQRDWWVKGILWFLLITIPVIGGLKYHFHINQPDQPREIAAYLNEHIEGKTLFIDKGKHVIHYLTNTSPLSKYYHPSLIYKPSHFRSMGIDQRATYEHIFAQKPDFVLYTEKPTSKNLEVHLGEYVVEKEFGEVVLLRRE